MVHFHCEMVSISVQESPYMHFTLSLTSSPNVAFETDTPNPTGFPLISYLLYKSTYKGKQLCSNNWRHTLKKKHNRRPVESPTITPPGILQGCLLGGVYIPCVSRNMPGGVIVVDSVLLLCACSMLDVNCLSTVTSLCLIVQKRSRHPSVSYYWLYVMM